VVAFRRNHWPLCLGFRNYLRRWQREGVWDRVHHALVMADRERAGRQASPSAAILDSQSVKTADQKGDQRVTTRARRLKVASVTS
jgi:transposase